jgi:hypothetical protein
MVRRRAVFLALGVVVLLFLGGLLNVELPVRSSLEPSGGVGTAQLAAASASLRSGEGPAAGLPETCSGASSIVCSAADSAPSSSLSSGHWTNLTTQVIPAPTERQTAMVWDAADGYALLFGGFIQIYGEQQYYGVSDTWTYLNGVWTNITSTVIGGTPPNGVNPILAYDPFESEVVLFGGADDVSLDDLSQTWTYHAGEWTNITSTAGAPPYARAASLFAADLADQQMVLWGGLSQNATRQRVYAQSDTWIFKDNTWSNVTSEVSGSPPALIYVTGAYDPAESGIVLLGTTYPAPYASETYLYSAGKWTNLSASLPVPGPRAIVGVIGWLPSISSLILSSGILLPPTGDSYVSYPVTWAFNDGIWVNITGPAGTMPSATLAGYAVLPDGSLFAFGGTPNAVNATAYSYDFSLRPNVTALTANRTSLVEGASVRVNATFSNGISPYVYNISWGDGQYTPGTVSAIHAYSTTGNFTITFSVSDFASRSASKSVNVTVTATPPGKGGGGSGLGGLGLYVLIGVVVAVIAVAVGLIWNRSRKRPTAPAPPGAASPSSPTPPTSQNGAGPPSG